LPDSPVSVVVPVFNSAATLGELCDRIGTALAPGNWELILVNDGSEDESWERIVALAAEHPPVRGVDLARNFGQHNALLAGIHSARHAVIVTLDDDLQDRPEEIPRLLEALGPETDLVYGVPVAKRRSAPRLLATKAMRGLVQGLTAGRIPADIGGFRAFRASLLDGVDSEQGAHIALDTLLTKSAEGIATVPVQHDPRREGRTTYTAGRMVGHALIEFASLLPRRGRASSKPTYVVRRRTA
jgi:undecaprenyl-phosphate 4-deoxy-4-formamido-L-arabinose transferase